MPYIELPGHSIFYSDQGQGEPVLLLHGLGSRSEDWELQFVALAKHYRVIAMDFRGHGKTPLTGDSLSIPVLASDVQALIKHLNLPPVRLVGFSLGGMVAMELATWPNMSLHSLVIINSSADMQIKSLAMRWTYWLRIAVIKLFGLKRLARMIGNALFPASSQAELIEMLVESMSQMKSSAYISTLKAIVGWSVTERLANIHCHTLVISADNDYTSVEEKEEYVRLIPSANFSVINHSRHATPMDQPAVLNQVLLNFFSSVKKLDADQPENQQPNTTGVTTSVMENDSSIMINARG